MTSEQIILAPALNGREDQFIGFCRDLCRKMKKENDTITDIISAARGKLRKPFSVGTVSESLVRYSVAANIVLDLALHGWQFQVIRKTVRACPPAKTGLLPSQVKENIRRGHLVERNQQLGESSVQQFVQNMERKRLTKTGWHSIFSLMRDGRDLYRKLNSLEGLQSEQARLKKLSEIISPYIEFVDADTECSQTGLRLQDIWRYFRHTWTNAYKSLPGRSLQILIRDGAAPNHAVIGIGALGSSVVQQTVRDKWIGWDADSTDKWLDEKPPRLLQKWISGILKQQIDQIYKKDVDGIIDRFELMKPQSATIRKLRAEGGRCKRLHRKNPQPAYHKSPLKGRDGNVDWERQAKTSLFRAKRYQTLASLLQIKKVFQDHNILSLSPPEFKKSLKISDVRIALRQLIRLRKGERVGVDMMDIIVCGAIAPYNHLLGGKLICMLMAAPEIVQFYRRKYSLQPSVIASSMKGSQAVRDPKLVLLSTTSLYGVGSSQYNRVRIPASEVGGKVGEEVRYFELGLSEGFGSYHLSKETIKLMDILMARHQNGRPVNFIFGEGVNPRMRHIREGLNLINLPSDKILVHGNPRLVYGISLAKNFRDVLLGFSARPQYVLPQRNIKQRTQLIAAYWQKRWLLQRIGRKDVIAEVAKHSLSYPITHGARVPLLQRDDYLFDQVSS